MQPSTGVRTFATRPIGRVLLIAAGAVTVGFGMLYLGEVLGIAVLLLFGFLLPVYMGWKRPLGLAIAGLVILLLAAPIASVLYTQQTFEPSGAFSTTPGVLQNATVDPYSGAGGGVYDFNVELRPAQLNASYTLENVTLFVSTCPDSWFTNDSTLDCSPPYTSYTEVSRIPPGAVNATTLHFYQKLPGPNIYYWTMYAVYSVPGEKNISGRNGTSCDYCLFVITGNGPNGLDPAQGPIVGSFLAILGIVILPVYEFVLFYPGIAFVVVLLIYAWFKQREARRKAAEAASGPPPGPGAPASSPGAPGGTTPAAQESHCPKCGAVVYANETQCWKCGTLLTPPAAPLPSSGPSQR